MRHVRPHLAKGALSESSSGLVGVSFDTSRYGQPECVSGLPFLIGTLPREVASSKTQYGVGTPATTPHVVNVLHKGVRLCPSHNQVAAVIRDELLAKVLVPKIAQYRADELRGNAGSAR